MTNTEPTKSNKTKKPKYKVSYHKDGALHVSYQEQLYSDIDETFIKNIEEKSVITHLRTGAYWDTEKKIVHWSAGEYGSYYWDEVYTTEDFCEVVAAIEDGSAFIE